MRSNDIPLAKTGIYACGVSQKTEVASAKPDTMKQENSRLVDLYRFLLAEKMKRDESGMLKYRLYSESNPGKFVCIAKCEIDGRETYVNQILDVTTDADASVYFEEFLENVFGEYDTVFDIEIIPMENVASESASCLAKMLEGVVRCVGDKNEEST